MSEDRTLRKLKKLTKRLSTRMEEMRDLMDDMEIEFEMMQKQIIRLEKGKKVKSSSGRSSKSDEALDDAEETNDDIDEDIDLENATTVFVKPKF
jgi:Sec-independent protein translocase protein TatA